jgi:hypothetical protein
MGMSDLMPTRGRIMALLSPPSQDVYLDVEDARWIKAEIERLRAALQDIADCITHDYSRRDIQATALAALEDNHK